MLYLNSPDKRNLRPGHQLHHLPITLGQLHRLGNLPHQLLRTLRQRRLGTFHSSLPFGSAVIRCVRGVLGGPLHRLLLRQPKALRVCLRLCLQQAHL